MVLSSGLSVICVHGVNGGSPRSSLVRLPSVLALFAIFVED